MKLYLYCISEQQDAEVVTRCSYTNGNDIPVASNTTFAVE